MEKIGAPQLFELFLHTLDCCGMFLLKCDAQDIEYYLFEEFDTDSISFLHENTLNILLENDYISPDAYSLCKLLNERFRKMEGTNFWDPGSVKDRLEWHAILELADKIKSIVRGNASSIKTCED